MGKETGLVTGNKARNLVHQSGENLTTTSLIVAEVFHKQHGHVIRDIEKLEIPEDVRLSNFGQSSYINDQGKSQPMYEISKDGFTLLAMGFTGKKAMEFKLKFLAEFNRMEQEISLLREKPRQIEAGTVEEMLLQALQGSAMVLQRQIEDRKSIAAQAQTLASHDQALSRQENQIKAIAASQEEELFPTPEDDRTLRKLTDKLISSRAYARGISAGEAAKTVYPWLKQRLGMTTWKTISRAQVPMAFDLLKTAIAREEAAVGQVKLLRPQDF